MIENHNFNDTVNQEIIDLDLSVTKKKKFRFDHDDSRILELNTSDMGLIGRISETYPKMQALQTKASAIMDGIDIDEDDETVNVGQYRTIAERLKLIDAEMRDLLDEMFHANVSEVAAPEGSMYDPFNGSFRFEYIITLLMKQYETNLQSEFTKLEKQLKSHTNKYTNKGK